MMSAKKFGQFALTAIALAASGSAFATSQKDCLLNWAERNYSSVISAPVGTSPITSRWQNYVYRYYPNTRSFAGVGDDGRAYYLPPNSGTPQDLGLASSWYSTSQCTDSSPVLPPTTASCQISVTNGGTTLCANELLVDGKSWTGGSFTFAAAGDLDGDGNFDFILAPDFPTPVVNTTNPANLTSVIFLKSTNNPYNFSKWKPNIIGGDANAFFIRELFVGNFGDGHTGFYIEDASEYTSPTQNPTSALGSQQYIYIGDGTGNFLKKNLNLSGGTSVHGATVGSPVDGFTLGLNFPWNGANSNNQIFATVSVDGNGNVTPANYVAPLPKSADNFYYSGGACFYTVAIHVDKPGRSKPAKRDLICFSQTGANVSFGNRSDNHSIWYNDGNGKFSQYDSDVLLNSHSNPDLTGWTVENVAVANFSGHTDGREDFIVWHINRSGVGTNGAISMRIFINEGGTFTDKTTQYFGGSCTNCLADFSNKANTFYYHAYVVDYNNDGISDLIFTNRVPNNSTPSQYNVELLQGTGSGFIRKSFVMPNINGNYTSDRLSVYTLPNGKVQFIFHYPIWQNDAEINRLFIGNFQ